MKLGDYSLGKRLYDVCSSVEPGPPSGVRFQGDSLPNLGRGGKKADIFRLVRSLERSNFDHYQDH